MENNKALGTETLSGAMVGEGLEMSGIKARSDAGLKCVEEWAKSS